MSRPTASVPSMFDPNSQSGGRNARERFWAVRSEGAIKGADSPTAIRISTITPPAMIFGVNRGRMAARSRRLRPERGSAATSASRAALFSKPDPRIDQGIQKVDGEIDDDERDRVGEHGAGDQRIIARLDRGDQQRA